MVVPVLNEVPPVGTLYQFKVPAEPVALKDNVPASHLAAGVVVRTLGVAFTVAITAVLKDVQELFVAST